MRTAGILMPISSLASNYGIGTFSKEAYEFVDWLEKAGQSYWQVLPMGPTSYGDSPYQSFSTFAGNPYFIDLDALVDEGLLTQKDILEVYPNPLGEDIDYERLYRQRLPLLKKAFGRFKKGNTIDFNAYIKKEEVWLTDYALFMVIKDRHEGAPWTTWEKPLQERDEALLHTWCEQYEDDIMFYCFVQYLFNKQWHKLKDYANSKGIEIIGDIPIYVAHDSADTWANQELFELDSNKNPIEIAGCPPDSFSATGQRWGNPVYYWPEHKRDDYAWWIRRIAHCFQWYDSLRIDHFRGFDEYYAIDYREETAEKGSWKKGPGYDIFKHITNAIGQQKIIAEDLGYITPSVVALVERLNYPGMKVLQFAFDSREDSDYLPHNYHKQCVVYTGTHDNDTTKSWYASIPEQDRLFCKNYLNMPDDDEGNVHWYMIRAALASVSDTAIIPIQDYLGLGSDARINTPSTLGMNWRWRLQKGALSKGLASHIASITKLYGR